MECNCSRYYSKARILIKLLLILLLIPANSYSGDLAKDISSTSGININVAKNYSKIIKKYSTRYLINPYLVVALINRESRFNPLASSKKNYGLMQVRVSRTTNSKYLGKEHLLFNPELNIRLGMHLLNHWRKYHFKNCKNKKHYWFSHYQWGAVVRSNHSGIRVFRDYFTIALNGVALWEGRTDPLEKTLQGKEQIKKLKY